MSSSFRCLSWFALTLALLAPSCAPEAPSGVSTVGAPATASPATVAATAPAIAPAIAPAAPPATAARDGAAKRAIVPNARAVFQQALRLIEQHYIDGALAEDALWTAALEGVLARLVQLPNHPVNALIEPAEYARMKLGLEGAMSGVGIALHTHNGVVSIDDVYPATPAGDAGLLPGDRILEIDGRTTRGLPRAALFDAIRGADGTVVQLRVQRDARDWVLPLTRRRFQLASLDSAMLDDSLGYLRIHSFTSETARSVDDALRALLAKGARGLVVDLRDCPGGLFNPALEVASRFLPEGARILTLRKRDGAPSHELSKGAHPAASLPLVVLINGGTSSGAEILAAALADGRAAPLVGEGTLGKGTVETVLDLPQGWAVKLSIGRFVSPRGRSWQGEGLRPDFPLPGVKTSAQGARRKPDPLVDPQLQGALRLFALRAPR